MRAEPLEADAAGIDAVAGELELAPAERALLAPDHPFLRCGTWRLFASLVDGRLAARFVASVDARQQTAAGGVGCIGFGWIAQPGGAGEAGPPDDGMRSIGRDVLDRASGWLAKQGAARIRFPVQLSTWYGHRAVTGPFPADGGAEPFYLEPRNDARTVDLATAAGFAPAHRAVSFSVTPEAVITSAGHALPRLAATGVRDRPLRAAALDDEIDLLHGLSTEVFRASWAFSEISLDEFRAIYRPVAARIDPELVRVLETPSGDAIGFAFAIPDPGNPGVLIVKTLGITAEAQRRHLGSGAALTALLHHAARARGYQRAVHALMAEGSGAHRLSARWGTLLRTYATYERAA